MVQAFAVGREGVIGGTAVGAVVGTGEAVTGTGVGEGANVVVVACMEADGAAAGATAPPHAARPSVAVVHSQSKRLRISKYSRWRAESGEASIRRCPLILLEYGSGYKFRRHRRAEWNLMHVWRNADAYPLCWFSDARQNAAHPQYLPFQGAIASAAGVAARHVHPAAAPAGGVLARRSRAGVHGRTCSRQCRPAGCRRACD
jgi:hypothetical protein